MVVCSQDFDERVTISGPEGSDEGHGIVRWVSLDVVQNCKRFPGSSPGQAFERVLSLLSGFAFSRGFQLMHSLSDQLLRMTRSDDVVSNQEDLLFLPLSRSPACPE